MGRDRDDRPGIPGLPQLRCGLISIEHRHLDVHQNEIVSLLGRFCDGVRSVIHTVRLHAPFAQKSLDQKSW